MNSHFGSTLSKMNYQTDKMDLLNINYVTNNSSITGGREYIALPSNTKITWKVI